MCSQPCAAPSPGPSALTRLRAEYRRMAQDPPPHVRARPDEDNLLEWFYVLEGPPSSAFEGGLYLGKLLFPPAYPFRPPSIQMLTPNGKFKTNTSLCFSMTEYHPESWNPLWSVSSILSGFLSFMLESSSYTYGSLQTTNEVKEALAKKSLEFNLKEKKFCELFPEYVEKFEADKKKKKEEKEKKKEEKQEQKAKEGDKDAEKVATQPAESASSSASASSAAPSLVVTFSSFLQNEKNSDMLIIGCSVVFLTLAYLYVLN